MEIRKFKPEEWRKIIQLWNRTLPGDPITENIFVKWLLTDPNYDPNGFRVLESNGEIKAAALGWHQVANSIFGNSPSENKKKGFLFPLLIEDSGEGVKYGEALLNDMDQYFRKHDKSIIQIRGLMALFPDGVDSDMCPVYIKNDFSVVEKIHSMRVDLYKFQIDESIQERINTMEKEGFTFVHFNSDDLTAIMDFFSEETPPIFRFEFQKKLQWGAPHDEFMFVKKGNEVVGFCQHNHYGQQPERVGPFMVARSVRGQKIGQALVAKFLESMAFKGFRTAYFNTSEEKNTHFYAKNGFKTFREKSALQKELK